MLYVVTGGSGSGKSEFAENLAVRRFQQREKEKGIGNEDSQAGEKYFASGTLLYVATMCSSDSESISRIERHKRQRSGKGFTTVECDVGIERLKPQSGDVVLLEDLSNLLANEMYLPHGRIRGGGEIGREQENVLVLQAEQAILVPIFQLEKQAACVIIVTNEIFSDGMVYDEETARYIRMLGRLNCGLAKKAANVVELVCGIPVWHKGEERGGSEYV